MGEGARAVLRVKPKVLEAILSATGEEAMPNIITEGKAGEVRLLQGNEAIARGALEAGVNVVTSSYPGTPSSEIPNAWRRSPPSAACT